MPDIILRRLETPDVARFIEMRIDQLVEEGARPTRDLAPALYAYYEKHMADESFVSWIALSGEGIVATSGLSFVERPPTYGNPDGKLGILSSMYTRPGYRRRGLARALLGKIAEEARARGCGGVQITASEMGVSFYENFGFRKNDRFLEFRL